MKSLKNTPLSNMAFVPVVFNGYRFRSVEHAYMYAKNPTDKAWLQFCLRTYSPFEVKKAGKTVDLRPDWNEVKTQIMWELLWQKYQVPAFKAALLATGTDEIVEGNNWGDTFWGVDSRKGGQNMLGFYLMEIRKLIA